MAMVVVFATRNPPPTISANSSASRRGRSSPRVSALCEPRQVGVLGIPDQIRPEAAGTVAALARLTGAAPVLLTGDNHATATQLAGQVGITDVCAGLLPEDK